MKEHNRTSEANPPARSLCENLRGILLPFVTPFGEEMEVDARGIGANLDKWNETGVRGYVALGSTGERVHLSERECLTVLETARAHVPSSLSLIVGAGQQSTRLTIDEVQRWTDAGADGVLVITPGYYRAQMTQAALLDYYRAVADASSIPVLLYNIPQLTSITLAPETVARLAEHENIIGIKDSSGDMVALGEMLRLLPEEFSVMTGHGSTLFAALGAGATGAILAIGCVAARACVEAYRAFEAGDYERARSLQRKIAFLVRNVMVPYGIGGIKAAMDALSYKGGHVRAPLVPPGEAARLEIAKLLEESELFYEEMSNMNEEQRLRAGVK